MAAVITRIAFPKVNESVLSICSRTARLVGVIGMTGLFGAQVLSKPIFVRTQCQGIVSCDISEDIGGVAPRHQYTQADLSLKRSRAPIDFQQLSSGSVLGMVTGYLTAKIGQVFLFSFGGLFLLAAVLSVDD
jgi:FUN14 family